MTEVTPRPDERLLGKVAVVTGAARGIGRATAVAFAHAGAEVIRIDICASVDPRSGVKPSTPEDLEETGRLVDAATRRWLGIVIDQRDLTVLRAAAARVEKEFGGLDIPVRKRWHQSFHPLLEMQDEDWHITIDNNLTGTANAIRAFAPSICETRRRSHYSDLVDTRPAWHRVRSRLLCVEMGNHRLNEVGCA